MSWHFLEQNPSALHQACMNVRNLILWIFVTALVEVALEELNERKNAGQLTSSHSCWGRACFHPHPFTRLLREHASTCTLTCSCHQLFFQVNFTIAIWKHPFRVKKKPLQNHKHQHKALGAGTTFDSGFNFFYVKTQQTSSCVSVSLQLRVSRGLVHTVYLRPRVCRLLSLLPLTISAGEDIFAVSLFRKCWVAFWYDGYTSRTDQEFYISPSYWMWNNKAEQSC